MSKKRKKTPKESFHVRVGRDVGAGAAIGHDAQVKADQIAGESISDNIAGRDIIVGQKDDPVANAFAEIYIEIESKTFPSESDSQHARELVELIEEENEKGDKGNEKAVRLSFNSLAKMAPDIWEVAITTLANPVLGVSTVIKKIAEKAKAESKGADKD